MKEYKYFSDDEVRDFGTACYQTASYIQDIAHYLQKELKAKTMEVSSEEMDTIRVQFKYLNTLVSRITNEAENLKETNNG